MSTKTTFKRVALVAVASLGFGLLSSVPSNAANPTTWALGTATANVAVVGQTSTITVPVTVTTNAASTDSLSIAVIPSAWPSGSAVDAAADVTAVAGSAVTASGSTTGAATWGVSNNIATLTFSASTGSTYVTSASATFTFTADKAGSYTLAYFTDGNVVTSASGAIKSADTVKYITVTAVENPATTVAFTQQQAGTGAVYDATAASQGIWLRVNAKDAAGAVTRLSSSQLLLLTVPSTLTIRQKNNGSTTTTGLSVSSADYGLAASDFNSSGYAWINVTAAAAGTSSISGVITGSAAAGSSISVTYKAVTAAAAACAAAAASNPDATDIPAAAAVNTSGITAAAAISVNSTDTSGSYTVCGATSASVVNVRVVDTDKTIFGNATALSQDLAVTLSTTDGDADALDGTADKYYGSVAVAHTALGTLTNSTNYKSFTLFPNSSTTAAATGSSLTSVVTGVKSAIGSGAVTVKPAASVRVVNGGSITFTATYTDQYGVAKTGVAVTASVTAGRNLSTVATALVTDATGTVSYTVTDAAPTSTTATSTVTFTGGAAKTATITWVAALTAATLTTSPSATTADTAAKAATLGAVSVSGTASDGAVAVTATAKDADGVLMAGLPVTITLPADVLLKSTSPAVAYTNASGVASWSVYTSKAATYAFTFAGGGLTKTSYGKFTAGSARVVSATAGTSNGGVTPVTIKVADAHGNGVGSTSVSLSATGGYFQGIPMTSSQNTDADGNIVVAFVGSGSVKATISGGQSLDLAALVGTTAAAGYPAGVASVTVTVDGGTSAAETASDAAAEATDAANAATDAANAAAEAADAATAAAQDAADAVAALSAQVATLISGLKSQLTALTNLVIKIQKKVKA